MSEDFATARDQLYDAIRECRVFFSNMRWGSADGFEFVADNGDKVVTAGGSLALNESTFIRIKTPQRATVKIVANGEKVLRTLTDQLEYRVQEPGIYRVEVWKNGRGWIFSNHLRVTESGKAASL